MGTGTLGAEKPTVAIRRCERTDEDGGEETKAEFTL